jgi:PAS domain S-box-containing protein
MSTSAAMPEPNATIARISPHLRSALGLLAMGLTVMALSWVAIAIPRELDRTSPLWLANGAALAVLLACDRRRWPWLLAAATLGNLAANFLAGDAPALAFIFAFCNGLEVGLSAVLLRRLLGPNLDFSRGRDLSIFCAVSGVGVPLLSAFIATIALNLTRHDPFSTTFLSWAAADGLGAMLITPVALTLRHARARLRETPLTPAALGSIVLLIAVSIGVFSQTKPMLFFLPGVLLLAVFHLEILGAVVGVTIIATVALYCSLMNLGPAVAMIPQDNERMLMAQVFLAFMLLTSLPTAAVLAQRRRLSAEVAEQYRRAQLVEDVAGVGYFRFDHATGSTFWSDRMFQIFGQAPGGRPLSLADSLQLMHPDDRERVTTLFRAAFDHGQSYESETRLILDGELRYLFGRTVCETGPGGEPTSIVGTVVDITAMKTAQAQLLESQDAVRHLAENVTDVILKTSVTGELLYISPAIEGLLGYKPEELVGAPNLNMVCEEDRQRVTDTVIECLRTKGRSGLSTVEYRGKAKDGRLVWMESRPRTVTDPVTGRITMITDVVRDITERKLAEAALAESEQRFRQIAEVSNDLIIRINAKGDITYVSPSVRRYGYEPADIIGRPRGFKVHPDDRPRTQRLLDVTLAGGPDLPVAEREHRLLTADGAWVWVESSPAVIRDETGAVVEMVSTLRDITERKVMEAELERAKAEAEAAAAVKGEFLANMSHELRTPLTSVLGFTRLALEQPELSAGSRDYIAKAARAGEALLTTVNDILDFSKLEAGQVEIRPRPCDAAEVCRETLELFSQAAAEKGLTLTFKADKSLPIVNVDPDRLRQLLLNLVGNAVKFSDQGEIAVGVRWRARDRRLLVDVRDQGPGIARAQQDLLFKRFSQVDGSSTRRHGGTGLGLAICMGLTEAMGGSIGVESAEGRGSRFFFEIAAPKAGGKLAAPDADSPQGLTRGVRVLVADDHAVNRELVRAVLTPLGAIIAEAANGAEAVEAAATTPFDLIFMDLRMPVMDGVAAVRAIRQGDGPNAGAPIIAFSAGSEALDDGIRQAAGFDAALAKPMLPADLLALAIHFTTFDPTADGRGNDSDDRGRTRGAA